MEPKIIEYIGEGKIDGNPVQKFVIGAKSEVRAKKNLETALRVYGRDKLGLEWDDMDIEVIDIRVNEGEI